MEGFCLALQAVYPSPVCLQHGALHKSGIVRSKVGNGSGKVFRLPHIRQVNFFDT
jgi:hypothetical protein